MRKRYTTADLSVLTRDEASRFVPRGDGDPQLDLALAWIREVQPKRALLTHMDNSMDYRTLVDELPEGVEPAYDGMEIAL